jgi:ferritin-like metal-binding protein YciE
MMQRQLERTGDCPELEGQLRSHLQETGKQLRRLERCQEQCREAETELKDLALTTFADLTFMAHATACDEILITDH